MLVERQDLQFDRQVDLTDVNAVRNRQDARRKVENAGDTGRHESVSDTLRGVGGRRNHRNGDVVLGDDTIKVVDVTHQQAVDRLTHPGRVGVLG